ncbi:MAG: S41 family peptidase, partial [Bryobacterales bacterium]|nr:S41 family peptidase [Bryobacterales bacterium]
RNNPGGLLNEGVAVADRWLERGQTVVKHSGRAQPERRYEARHGGGGRNYPVVVLVNRYSASAAEIVAGALQDHDRAWIFGENTFGKGLVQTVFPMAENTGLALTTARYYTPSNRLIQRDYTNKSFFDYYYRKDLDSKNANDVGMTDTGRKVYGGGGIAPDEKYEEAKGNRVQATLIRGYAFLNFVTQYFSTNERNSITESWTPPDAMVAEFKASLKKQGFELTEADLADNDTFIRQQLRKEVFVNVFDVERSKKMTIETDPTVLKAIESLPKAKELLDKARQLLVQRRTR